MTEAQCDVVVVGAGPVGLSLALGLARANRSVLVFEKEASTSEYSRAPVIWPRTQEILSDLGVIDRALAEGIVRSHVQVWDADRERVLVRFPIEELRGETAFPQLLICPQSRTERILLDAVQGESSAEVRFSSEVTGLEQTDDGVEVRYEQEGNVDAVTSTFVAGCDGAHSQVRETVADAFDGRTFGVRAALADVTFEQKQNLRFPRLTRRRGVAVGIRVDERLWRIIMPRFPEEALPLDQRIEQSVADLFSTSVFDTVWKSEFKLHRRSASSFVRGRIALAGDAAHLTSPVGGQGMNLGIQDAAALQRALLSTLETGYSSSLSRYVSERRAAIETGAVWATDQLTQVLLARGGTFLAPVLRIFGLALRVRPLRRVVMRRMAMLDDPSRVE